MRKKIIKELSSLKRLPSNRNLSLTTESHYEGFPIKTQYRVKGKFYLGPIFIDHLKQSINIITSFTDKYPRVQAVRLELLYPKDYSYPATNQHISRFFKSLNYRIDKYYLKRVKAGKRGVKTEVGYIWTREQETSDFPHYHLLVMVNHDAFNGLGGYDNPNGLFGMMRLAWAAALDVSFEKTEGIVSASNRNGESSLHFLNRNRDEFKTELKRMIGRVSYMCKVKGKQYVGNRERNFGVSTNKCEASPMIKTD